MRTPRYRTCQLRYSSVIQHKDKAQYATPHILLFSGHFIIITYGKTHTSIFSNKQNNTSVRCLSTGTLLHSPGREGTHDIRISGLHIPPRGTTPKSVFQGRETRVGIPQLGNVPDIVFQSHTFPSWGKTTLVPFGSPSISLVRSVFPGFRVCSSQLQRLRRELVRWGVSIRLKLTLTSGLTCTPTLFLPFSNILW